MSKSWKTIGHEVVKSILEKQLVSGRVPHAYLFVGPSGIGKKLLAQELAGRLLGSERPEHHPDFASLSGEATVEELRDFTAKLSVKPFSAAYTVAILDDVHRMNPSSSNALLKTLEEPSPTTILILISNTASILPTVVSRCQVFSFNSFSDQALRTFWEQTQSSEVSGDVLSLASGSPARLLRLRAEPEAAQALGRQLGQLSELRNANRSEKILAVDQFAALDPDELTSLLEGFLFSLRSSLADHPEAAGSMRQVLVALSSLRAYMNKKLVLERLFLSF